MKKLIKTLILSLFVVSLISTSCMAKEYRVIADVQFQNEEDAIALMNYIESIKDKVVQEETKAGWVNSVKFVESWDTATVNKSEFTRNCIDFKDVVKTHKIVDVVEINKQEDIDVLQILVDKKQSELNDLNSSLTIKKSELVDLKTIEINK